MASESGHTTGAIDALLLALEDRPSRFDLFQALRRLECAFRDHAPLGADPRLAEQPIRLGQDPSLAFEPRAIAAFDRSRAVPRLSTFHFGVFGPMGPLPLHLTEHAYDRLHNAKDKALVRFLDLFHHRLLSLFYRAHAAAEPAVAHDRPDADPFERWLGSLCGLGWGTGSKARPVADVSLLRYAGLLAAPTRNAEGLAALLGDYFGIGARVDEFIGEWVETPPEAQARLGDPSCTLGAGATLGRRAWICSGKVRITLGPLRRGQYEALLPDGKWHPQLADLVATYAGKWLAWDLKLVLARPERPTIRLKTAGRLGWDAALAPSDRTRLPPEEVTLLPRATIARSEHA